jgi:hypothetical protein
MLMNLPDRTSANRLLSWSTCRTTSCMPMAGLRIWRANAQSPSAGEAEDHFVRRITVAGVVALMLTEPRLEAVDCNARVFDMGPCPVLAPSR